MEGAARQYYSDVSDAYLPYLYLLHTTRAQSCNLYDTGQGTIAMSVAHQQVYRYGMTSRYTTYTSTVE